MNKPRCRWAAALALAREGNTRGFLPPVGVFLEVGLTGHFWLNILLTLLGYVPGIIHALYVILKH